MLKLILSMSAGQLPFTPVSGDSPLPDLRTESKFNVFYLERYASIIVIVGNGYDFTTAEHCIMFVPDAYMVYYAIENIISPIK